MINYNILAIQSLVSNAQFVWYGSEWEGLEWKDSRSCPTKEEWEAERAKLIAQQPLNDCKAQAQILLNESDFADLYSVRNKLENIDEWDNYRNQIRELRINPIENPVFPDKPQTIWKEI